MYSEVIRILKKVRRRVYLIKIDNSTFVSLSPINPKKLNLKCVNSKIVILFTFLKKLKSKLWESLSRQIHICIQSSYHYTTKLGTLEIEQD